MPYATGSIELALTVRGSSRRIMIMRFRPANIRLINRRSTLPRLLLALTSGNNDNYKGNPTDLAELTRSLHIRWDEKAGLQRDAISSQVIDALEAREIEETGDEEAYHHDDAAEHSTSRTDA